MKKFSERVGAVSPPSAFQTDSVSENLRNSLWNLFHSLYHQKHRLYWKEVAAHVAEFFRKVPVDDVPYEEYECRPWLKKYFFSLEWYALYDFLEFLVNSHLQMTRGQIGYGDYRYHDTTKKRFIEQANSILDRELSGYRFVADILSPITTPTEVEAIEDAAGSAASKGFQGAHEHLTTALRHLGKKPNPDYRNSIKESISAVESVATLISGEEGGGLEKALNKLSDAAGIHGALKSGFLKLYGYSSDEDGIRHAILEESNVGFIEAKYMLVACSAFVSYLISKGDSARMLPK
jgi:hypothetical protein